MTFRRRALLVALVVMAAGGCATGPTGTTAPVSDVASPTATAAAATDPVGLTVFAAASLRRAMEAAVTAYEVATPGTTIALATDSSAALRTQIEQGAPADVFLSADTTNPQTLVDGGLADGPAVAFAANELTIIVPDGDPGGIAMPADLGRAGVRVIAAGEEVPITRYATQLVRNLAVLDGFPTGFAAAYEANVVSREDNVAAVVAKIELGEGDAAIVYATDAMAAGATVEVVAVPAEANVRATYAGVVIDGANEPAAAHDFLDWLLGAGGQAVLGGFGFLPPPS